MVPIQLEIYAVFVRTFLILLLRLELGNDENTATTLQGCG
jgi:hypothetical protein